jgi:hypothetical protein
MNTTSRRLDAHIGMFRDQAPRLILAQALECGIAYQLETEVLAAFLHVADIHILQKVAYLFSWFCTRGHDIRAA